MSEENQPLLPNLKEANRIGRPTVVDDGVLLKLEQAFAFGSSDLEACFYADISPTALYEYQKRVPEFTERKKLLKERPVLKARQSVVNGMDKDPRLAMDYLKAKKSNEFKQRHDIATTPVDTLLTDEEAKAIELASIYDNPPPENADTPA